jgi:hypothetical protein
MLYFLSYISKIKENENQITILKKDLSILRKDFKTNEKLLNTIKDIVILNKKGVTNTDVLEWLKIAITLIIGAIIIKALISLLFN